jgi:hypothetical protein
LLEPQRTNFATFSEQLNLYTAIQGSVTANASTSPDGYTNADKFVVDNGLEGRLQQLIAITAATHTFSAFAKADGLTSVSIQSRDNASAANEASVTFNLSTGVISTSSATGAFSAVSGTITDYGSGWYRCTTTFTSSISTTTRFRFFTPIGNGTNGLLLYGAQAELNASYPTSYIPTLGSSVTRLADAASKTGISSLIGQSEGTLFIDMNFTNRNEVQVFIEVGNGTTQRVLVYCSGNSIIAFANASVFSYTQTANERIKIAFAYKSGDSALYVNGVQKQVDSSALTFSSLSNLYLGQEPGGTQTNTNPINTSALYTTRLSNSELASLTSL